MIRSSGSRLEEDEYKETNRDSCGKSGCREEKMMKKEIVKQVCWQS